MSARERPPAARRHGSTTEQDALDAALRLLAVRDRSRQELVTALTRRGFTPAVQHAVLARLLEDRYLDDSRFAAERARSLFQRGRFGARGVLQRLLAHGIPEEEARRAVEAVGEELAVDPLADGRRLLERRGLAGRPLTPKERARAGRLLDARGFGEEEIHRLLSSSGMDPSTDER
ncbi:MAG: RecX family transcriptional regulator [Myxococcaceae bacterium]|nr:RecX family transcriptional regulator [Myxococcaceae bacterium]MCI0671418.1 RecX family transcriptional regulator [Myxococcaceae bacterium]